MKKILILAANPIDTSKLRLDVEVREIQAAHRQARNREEIEIISGWAVRVDDLRSAILYHKPNIVHFCGHGAGDDGLLLENKYRNCSLVIEMLGLLPFGRNDGNRVVIASGTEWNVSGACPLGHSNRNYSLVLKILGLQHTSQ
jgi:hypothetical protein